MKTPWPAKPAGKMSWAWLKFCCTIHPVNWVIPSHKNCLIRHGWIEQHALKNVSNYLNTNFFSYLETHGGQSSNLYINVVHFSTPVLIRHLWQLNTVVFLHWCLICALLLSRRLTVLNDFSWEIYCGILICVLNIFFL